MATKFFMEFVLNIQCVYHLNGIQARNLSWVYFRWTFFDISTQFDCGAFAVGHSMSVLFLFIL